MMLMAASNNEAASVAVKLLPAPAGRGAKAGSGLHELLFTLLGQERVEWDAKLRAKLKLALLKDVAERDQTQQTMAALHDTIRTCSVEMDRLRAETDKKIEPENSNQVEELGEEKPEIDVADENPLALEPIASKAVKEEALRAPSPTATRRPSTSSTSQAPTRRRSSVRRKSLTLVSCKSSPGKVSMSPGKHGFANQLVLVKAKKSSTIKSGDAPSRLGIKIARKWKPLNMSLFSLHPNAAAIPAPVLELGLQQNAIMLRQLRYVKGVMHELPWAKSRLRDMLSHYTQKDLTKEDLFPQLSHLSVQVQDDLDAKAKAQKHVIEAKAKQATTLQLAKGIINELTIVKYGRRGKPHETKLYYDETHPCVLYWQSKQGDRSSSFLPLHSVKAIEVGHVTHVFKRAARKHADLDPSRCLSLVTEDRTLDLRLPNTLQRDWLLKALQDAVQYAVQYRATAPAKRSQGPHLLTPATPRLRRM
ncbi:hypothetical protein SPRG_09678 [Saprolegnia parasitica CBS 223.65]|uniref:PH domain-containing protein n=1 Tax=Saprolegnia parasitica (strain CBS 223.65) TaxID=695850 RepID=A0A067C6Q5_SAPPC|nr:hypothetical protein SPRG_09678 [Saprolegnia parasitica CBS 223.65]KDO24845.1 hypothetical protein SPRG_09678 [Saprolegnia parasitica CBS 223.65]|eukprot:XP_012204492.1 hypothetical protein SPRG_09678 [Saprolegnia parasitica CBS 223.65]